MEEQMEFDILLAEIKKKKELSGLSNILIAESLNNYLNKNRIQISKLSSLSNRDKKFIVKEIRLNLRLLHGRFQASTKNREKMLSQGKIKNLLMTHSSTKERIDSYPKIKSLISKLNVKSILDLGCGLNPIALASKDTRYFAYDINEAELSIIKDFFKKNNIQGEVHFYDITKFKREDFPQADICLLLKIFDILKKRGYKLIESILSGIQCKHILVSFSTKKLSGKKMNQPKRNWFEDTLKKLNYTFEIIKTENEIFYLIVK
ncbi:MAG: hypothetical protein AABX85_00180 [Nanoarchaeota archaeon]